MNSNPFGPNNNQSNYQGNMNYPTAPSNTNYNYSQPQSQPQRPPNGGKFDSVFSPFDSNPQPQNPPSQGSNLNITGKDTDIEDANEVGIRNIGNSCYM